MKRLVLFVCLVLTGCAITKAIKDATYPDYYDVQFKDGSKSTGAAWLCVREKSVTDGQAPRADVLECADATPFYETLVGLTHRESDEKL